MSNRMKLNFSLSCGCLAMMSAMNLAAQETPSVDNKLETITVVAPKSNSIKISSQQLVTLPGTGNDPIKGLEALPGVILATPNSGGPISEPAIRGSSRNDNLYLTDGLDMGYIFHNDGLSVYNPLLIESFELKTGAWSAQYNNANGGVIMTTLRDANGDAPQNVLDLGIYRSGFLLERAVGDDAAFYVSFRESLVHTYIDNFIEDEDFSFSVPPRNRDYQAKYNWFINDTDKLTLSASGAKDYIEIAFDEDGRDIAKNPDLASGEAFQEYYHSQAIDWQRAFDDVEWRINLNHLQTNQQSREGDVYSWNADITEWILKSDNAFSGENFDAQFGFELSNTEIDSRSSGRLLPCNTEFEMCPASYFSDTFSTQHEFDIQQYTAYINTVGQLSDSFSYELGFSAIGSDLNDENYIEPRTSLNWQLSDEQSVRVAYGKHHTWIDDYRLLSPISGNASMKASRSEHYTLNYTHSFGSFWQARFETYYKTFDGLVVANPNAQKRLPDQTIGANVPQYLDVATGKAYGAELLINKSFNDNWLGWFSIAYSKTDRKNPLTNQTFNSEFDLPWVANMVVDYTFNERWSLGAKWRFQSGRRYTDVVSAQPYYDDNTNKPLFYIPQYEAFNASSVKNYHRLDLRLDYNTTWLGKDTNFYFEVLNVYGSRTIQEFEYTPDYSSYEKDYQFPDMPLPSVGVTITF